MQLRQNAAHGIVVIERWHMMFNGTQFSQRHLRGEALSKVELKVLDKASERGVQILIYKI